MWTEEQELFAVREESSVPGSVFRLVCRFAAQAVVLTAVALHLARLLRDSRSTLFPTSEKDFCKCVCENRCRGDSWRCRFVARSDLMEHHIEFALLLSPGEWRVEACR